MILQHTIADISISICNGPTAGFFKRLHQTETAILFLVLLNYRSSPLSWIELLNPLLRVGFFLGECLDWWCRKRGSGTTFLYFWRKKCITIELGKINVYLPKKGV